MIAIVAVLNGALMQTIMASQVFYGLSKCCRLSPVFSLFHPGQRTAVVAVATTVILLLAFMLPLEALAGGTSLVTLLIFPFMNFALWPIRSKGPGSIEV